MAHNQRAGTNGHRSNVLQDGHSDAPPSTMAAQLISNITTGNKPTRPGDGLQRLIAEIAETESQRTEITDLEFHIQYTHKLVYVLTRTVLERLSQDDPFLNVSETLSHSSDALDVFMTTIKDTPAVLDYVLRDGEDFESRGQEPLWLWLFPRILALLGRSTCESLTEKIKDLFFLSFQVISRSPRVWNVSSSFFSYLRESVASLLKQLSDVKIFVEASNVKFTMPPMGIDYSVYFHQDSDLINQVFNFTYQIYNLDHAFRHSTQLLSFLTDAVTEAAAAQDATYAFQDYLPRILDHFTMLHDLQKRRRTMPQGGCDVGVEIQLLAAVLALLSSFKAGMTSSVRLQAYIIQAGLLGSVISLSADLFSEQDQVVIASNLIHLGIACKDNIPLQRITCGQLQAAFDILCRDESRYTMWCEDFKKSVSLFSEVVGIAVPTGLRAAAIENLFDKALDTEFQRLRFDDDSNLQPPADDEPPQKRRKVSQTGDTLSKLVSELYLLLGRQVATDLDGLRQIAGNSYATLDETARCNVVKLLSLLPCAIDGHLRFEDGKDCSVFEAVCDLCDSPITIVGSDKDEDSDSSLYQEGILILEKIVQTPEFVESRRPRILAMIGLQRFLRHYKSVELLDLEISTLGQWCLRSLQSSTRELRIAAGRTVKYFCQSHASANNLVRKNRVITMEALRNLRKTESVSLQESCIMSWSQLGGVMDDSTFVFVLLELVKYLGHSNPIVSGVSYSEILRLADAQDLTVKDMFEPYWDVVAYDAVKDLVTRPQTTQYMADLMDSSVEDFLLVTQVHSLPYLVLNQHLDIIQRISQARQDEHRWHVLFEASNLTKILALLLQQSASDLESTVMSLFSSYDTEFNGKDLMELVKVEPASTAFHLLMAAGEADDSVKSRVRYGLSVLASHAPAVSGSQTRKNKVGAFLEVHILGLASRLIDIITATRAPFPIIERERAIKAVEELVRVAKSHSRVARPLLCSCLQSAISISRFQMLAFSAWSEMLRDLEDDDVEAMLESTFSIITKHWSAFDNDTRHMCHETVQYLLKHRTRLIRMSIINLPSLAHLELFQDVDAELQRLRTPTTTSNAFQIFSRRLRNENSIVVHQTLVELSTYLRQHQTFLQASAVSVQPDPVVGVLVRSILDTCVKFNSSQVEISQLAAECIGQIGCLDPNRVETLREHREMVVVSNFKESGESTDFVLFTLQYVLVPVFLSTTDTGLQGFFSYCMQQLLEVCDFRRVCGAYLRNGQQNSSEPLVAKWQNLPANIQDVLTPFLSSKYAINGMERSIIQYPIFSPFMRRRDHLPAREKFYSVWLRMFVSDLLYKPSTIYAQIIFPALSRAIKIRDTTVAHFLLPYLILHVVLEGTDANRAEIGDELLSILEYRLPANSRASVRGEWKSCLECVFRVLDYLSRWVQEIQLKSNQLRGTNWADEVVHVKAVLDRIPPEILSQGAMECKSYSRALFYWEQHIRDERNARIHDGDNGEDTELLERLQDIYSQIDEPDGIEGISAQLHVLDIEQQIIGHQKAGRWTAAQTWYEIKLAESPDDVDVQVNLLNCLKESGQHDVLLNYVEGMKTTSSEISRLLPFATEASWATNRWGTLEKYTSLVNNESRDDFNVRVGQALLALHHGGGAVEHFSSIVNAIRKDIASSMSEPTTASVATSHNMMLRLHALTELEMIAGTGDYRNTDRVQVISSLNRRIEVLGSFLNDKQYLLGIRRAAMKLSGLGFEKEDIAEVWLTSARLARKGNAMHQSFNAVLHASQLGDSSATIEHARLIWKEGNHRKAIGILEGAIKSNAFIQHNRSFQSTTFVTEVDHNGEQNLHKARAYLMLAKWQDAAGQSNMLTLRNQYQEAARTHSNWEKGHYYLGRHYNKLFESEKSLPADQQKENFLSGEAARLVIENYLRALGLGTKYLYQTLPRLITLWLDLGTQINQPLEGKFGHSKEFVTRIHTMRKQNLDGLHSRFLKYIPKVPAYMFYTALPQILSRIAHPNSDVHNMLTTIIVKVVTAFPQHTLWNLLAVCTSNQADRKNRGMLVLQTLQKKIDKKNDGGAEMRMIIRQGMKLTNELIPACNAGEFPNNRTSIGSLSKDLHFNVKACTPNHLVVPFERMLTASLPTLTDNIRNHKAFSNDVVTIQSFNDSVIVLSSLQKPRKLTTIGSDGRQYGLMCKPKDDLRKDQRLMEFNSMINRALKRDAESSRRQLYIKTYAVTPLNEECGLIEWVDGLKTLREILLALLKAMGISIQYKEIEHYCEKALLPSKDDKQLEIFQRHVLDQYPPVFHKWFVQQFPEPSAWFASRIRYTRSCAVMSMVGTILGLGDRHGENILFEEGNGGTFHVDFNCLFDKGQTFAKPEKVPFRLTHNMVDAMGIYNYEGPFRKSSELTLKILRQHEETLMTIMEAFVYDPTLDLLNKKPEKKRTEGVPQTGPEVLESIQRKVNGYLKGETLPLGVEGHVQELIAAATNHRFLAGMYLGWCSFL